MINNKGQVNKLMAWVIAIVVLIVVVYALVNLGIISSLKNILPGFEQQNATPGVFGQIRYDILNGEIRRFDGDWKNIDGTLEFYTLKNTVTEEDLKSSFDEFYLGNSRELGELYQKDGVRVVAVNVANVQSVNTGFFRDTIIYSRGAVITNVQEGGNVIVGHYYVDIDGSILYLNDKGEEENDKLLSNDRSQVIFRAAEWRDSVLSKSISIGGENFCVIRTDMHYLVVDLTEVRTEC